MNTKVFFSKLTAKLADNSDLLLKTALVFIVRLAGSLSGFIATIVISKQLGATSAGYYFLAFSIVTLLSAIGRVGTDNTVLRYTGAAYSENDWGTILSTLKAALIITSIVSLFLSFSLFFFSESFSIYIFNKPELADILKSISPAILFTSFFTLISMSLQGIGKVSSSVIVNNVISHVAVVLMVLVLNAQSPTAVAILYSISCLIAFGFGFIILLRPLKKHKSKEIEWNNVFSSCIPLWVVIVMTQTSQLSGQIITGMFSEAQDVARLAVAQKTAALVGFILVVVNLVIAPQFAALFKQNKLEELNRLALDAIKLMLFIALPVITLFLIFPGYIMSLFGVEFEGGKYLLQILILGQTVNILTGSVGYLLSMSGHEKDLRNSVLISAPLAVILCFILTPTFGVTGAAIATAIAFTFQSLLPAYWVYRRLGINILQFWK